MTPALVKAVLDALRVSELPEYLQGPRTWLVDVEQSLSPVIAGWVVDGEPALGASKLGGEPDLPPELSWPNGLDGPLSFICQINLSDVAAHDLERRLPPRGALYLFSVCDEEASYAGQVDETTTCVLHARDLSQLTRRTFPSALGARGRLREKKLAFAPSLLCRRLDSGADRFEEVRFDLAIEQALDAALLAAGSHTPELRMLCGASFFRREVAAEYSAQLEIELLGFAGELASRQFGEGELHVVIASNDLAHGQLERARVLFEPGT